MLGRRRMPRRIAKRRPAPSGQESQLAGRFCAARLLELGLGLHWTGQLRNSAAEPQNSGLGLRGPWPGVRERRAAGPGNGVVRCAPEEFCGARAGSGLPVSGRAATLFQPHTLGFCIPDPKHAGSSPQRASSSNGWVGRGTLWGFAACVSSRARALQPLAMRRLPAAVRAVNRLLRRRPQRKQRQDFSRVFAHRHGGSFRVAPCRHPGEQRRQTRAKKKDKRQQVIVGTRVAER